MKILLLIIIFVLIVGGIGFFLDKQFPTLGIKAEVSRLLQQAPTKTPQFSKSPTEEKKKTMYRWQDEQGQWHFGESPPNNVSATSVKQSKGNTYNDGTKQPDVKQSHEPKKSPVLFPQFTPAH